MYPGSYKSAIARSKRVLLAAGFPWSKTTGRYSPFYTTRKTTEGVKVTRVGLSKSIALHTVFPFRRADTSRWAQALAIQTLRDAGLPFDDRGWLECRFG